jgi:glutamyl-Q tRNA(Asp) synthetase
LKLQLQTGMSVRFSVPDIALTWPDRLLGKQQQQVATEVGDFVLKRSDGLWAYQLAVVVDDAAQGITHVVRGEDLADNTPRQILLQQALGLPALIYMHTPLVLGENAEKLSKQNGAQAIDTTSAEKALQALQAAAAALGLQTPAQENCAQTLAVWVNEWRARLS